MEIMAGGTVLPPGWYSAATRCTFHHPVYHPHVSTVTMPDWLLYCITMCNISRRNAALCWFMCRQIITRTESFMLIPRRGMSLYCISTQGLENLKKTWKHVSSHGKSMELFNFTNSSGKSVELFCGIIIVYLLLQNAATSWRFRLFNLIQKGKNSTKSKIKFFQTSI